MLHTVAMRLRKHTRKLGAFQAWNKCLNHLLELARAHVEAVMLTNILEGANKCEDLDARKSIKVRLLHCVSACWNRALSSCACTCAAGVRMEGLSTRVLTLLACTSRMQQIA